MPLVPFHAELVQERDPEIQRDLGNALTELAWSSAPMRDQATALAVNLLGDAVKRWPDDAESWKALGRVLWLANKKQEGLDNLERGLALTPNEEEVLEAAATMATSIGADEKAQGYWERAATANPWKPMNHINLALLLARRQQWPRVRSECQATTRVDPFNVEAHLLLAECALQDGKKEQARAEVDLALALQPSRAAEIHRRFDDRLR
jgi:tetratricopeptide (TPR) repeat protein